ncbi:MAG: hypothetical protein ACJA2S_002352 [Cyclobacteriaceae bacterium]|jgi:hypothetical protein
MKSIFLFILTLITFEVAGQSFHSVDTLDYTPKELSKVIDGEIVKVFSIDIDGDECKDFIALVKTDQEPKFTEYWISSNFTIWFSKTTYFMGIQYRCFMNLDNDLELEVFYATGYEDGIDYYFKDLDLIHSSENLIFYFNRKNSSGLCPGVVSVSQLPLCNERAHYKAS